MMWQEEKLKLLKTAKLVKTTQELEDPVVRGPLLHNPLLLRPTADQ